MNPERPRPAATRYPVPRRPDRPQVLNSSPSSRSTALENHPLRSLLQPKLQPFPI
jgi:hypothetical protein